VNLFFQVVQLLVLELQLDLQHAVLQILVSFLRFEIPVQYGDETYQSHDQVHKNHNEEEVLHHWRNIGCIEALVQIHAAIDDNYNEVGSSHQGVKTVQGKFAIALGQQKTGDQIIYFEVSNGHSQWQQAAGKPEHITSIWRIIGKEVVEVEPDPDP